MSKAVREKFEATHKVSNEARYVEQVDAYKHWQYPSVDHPVQGFYEAFQDGWQTGQEQLGEAVDQALADYGRGVCVHEVVRELKKAREEFR